MKEDILEQVVADYLNLKGYFTLHNVRYKPDKKANGYNQSLHNVPSDIDVIGFNPTLEGAERVWACNCKSWQEGVNIHKFAQHVPTDKMLGKKEYWKYFRELGNDVWAEAFIGKITELTGQSKFTHVTAITRATQANPDFNLWEKNKHFTTRMKNNPLKIITLKDMYDFVKGKSTTTLASSQLGRLMQLMKAAKISD